jgi:sulfur-oxidizing protein SoxY
MTRDVPRAARLSRRSFLALASAAVGAWVRPAWAAGPAGDRAGAGGSPAPPVDRDHALLLRVPRFTGNGAKVPIVVESAHPMTSEHRVTRVRVRNESDPISSKGTFDFTPANGRAYVAFQARMHEGASEVTAAAECNVHGTFSARSPIVIPDGTGGCGGAAPPAGRTPGEDVRGPILRVPELVERGAIRPGELIHVQVKMRHPSRTGLVFRDGGFVQESEPLHLDALEVFYGDEPVSHFALTSALSDDPLIAFALLARRGGRIRVVVTNSRGEVFEATQELRVT